MGVNVTGIQATIQFVEKVAESVVIGTAYETASRFQDRTPVDTGFAKNSWIVTTGRDDFGVPGNNDLEARIAIVNRIRLGQTVYINNGAEYIKALENGHSKQAPGGMVRVTLPEVSQIARDQLRDAKRAGR